MSKEYRVNHQIKANTVDVVLPDGTMNTETPLPEAIALAEADNLDLVEVFSSRNGKPSICKIADYGKMMYQQNKKKKANKQTHHIKEIKYGINISDHDLDTKHRKVEEFLSKRYIVKYVMELRGREQHRLDEAMNKINDNLVQFQELGTWKTPNISGGGRRWEVSTVLHPI